MRPGCVAEFATPAHVRAAVQTLRSKKYKRLDVYGPYPIEGIQADLGLGRSWLTWIVFPLAFGGAGLGYWIQWYVNGVNYPLNVGGRPSRAWPMFIPIAFETAVLMSGVGAFVLFFALSRLPRLWQPIFDVEGFESASKDRFWVAIDERDLSANPEHEMQLLVRLGGTQVSLVR